jgi:hypothetical protein
VLTIGAARALAGRTMENDAVQAGRLSRRIGSANPQRYKSIQRCKEDELRLIGAFLHRTLSNQPALAYSTLRVL